VDYLKICMDVWKALLDAIIHAASETPRPIPAGDPLRRLQEPLLYFMSALVEKFYKMKGATRSEEAFSTFEVEDEEDLEDLTDLVESFVGLVAEVFMEEVIEMLVCPLQSELFFFLSAQSTISSCSAIAYDDSFFFFLCQCSTLLRWIYFYDRTHSSIGNLSCILEENSKNPEP